MSQERKRDKREPESIAANRRSRSRRKIAAALGLVASVIVVVYLLPGSETADEQETSNATRATPTTRSEPEKAAGPDTEVVEPDDVGRDNEGPDEPAKTAETSSEARRSGFEKLKGRWLRGDGGYVIEVKDVAASGSMEAAYYNPRPIRVSRAKASQEGDTTKVFIELRDTGYPGCTYRLDYNSQQDRLEGTYVQAAMQQEFDVVFVRYR